MDKILRVLEMNSAPREFDSDYAEDVIASNQFVVVVKEIREALVSEGEEEIDDITKEMCCETCRYFWEPNEKYTGG
jgi:hypothetical protein